MAGEDGNRAVLCQSAMGGDDGNKAALCQSTVDNKDGTKFITELIWPFLFRETFDGVDFLWRNRTHHGNLSWRALLYERATQIVTLCDFQFKETASPEIAQWEDWDAIIAMLRAVAEEAAVFNGTLDEICFDELSEFILRLTGLPRENILSMRETVLQDVFFWTPSERTHFFMIKVQEFLKNTKFISEVEKSDICSSQWDSPEPRLGALNKSFDAVLEHCNDYRAQLNHLDRGGNTKVPKFSGTKKMDCVSLAYAAYTHQNQIHVNHSIDAIFRVKFVRLFVGLNQIIKSLETTVGAEHKGVTDGADDAETSNAMEE
ncbi:hypothetical protein ACQ4PT_044655 [Festuca glaucescens]